MDVTFLLGAGISIKAGVPSTKKLTDAILGDDGFYMHTSQEVLHRKNNPENYCLWRDETRLIQEYLSSLRRLGAESLGVAEEQLSYEDVYYVAEQVCDQCRAVQYNGRRNPLTQAFFKDLRQRLPPLGDDFDFQKPLRFVRGALAFLLRANGGTEKLEYLRVFRKMLEDKDVARSHIFTLNHDHVLEDYLDRQSSGERKVYFDGLLGPDGCFDRLDVGAYSTREERILLWKLHGSMNWFRWHEASGGPSRFVGRLNRSVSHDHVLHRNSQSEPYDPSVEGPALLVGTLNKAAQYIWEPFLDLFLSFRDRLKQTDRLLVCGHSFGDQAILTTLTGWLGEDQGRQVLAIGPNPDSVKSNLEFVGFREQFHVCKGTIETLGWNVAKRFFGSGELPQ